MRGNKQEGKKPKEKNFFFFIKSQQKTMYTAEDTSLGETNYRIFVIWVGFLFAAVKYNSYHHSLVFFFFLFFGNGKAKKIVSNTERNQFKKEKNKKIKKDKQKSIRTIHRQLYG